MLGFPRYRSLESESRCVHRRLSFALTGHTEDHSALERSLILGISLLVEASPFKLFRNLWLSFITLPTLKV